MYNTILVPLDGSKRAEGILGHVEELAMCFHAKVVLAQVIEFPPRALGYSAAYTVFGQEELKKWKKDSEAYLTALSEGLREKGIEVEICVHYGYAVEEIINLAERVDADLIAMASHGRTGLPRVFYGSVTAGVLHRVDRPLLLVRSLDGE